MSSDRDRKRDAESNELRVRRRPDGSEPAHEEPVAEVVLPTEAEAAALTEPGFASSANLPRKAEAMLGLQQTHGNAYVQRLVADSRREAEGERKDEVAPEVAQRIEAARGGGQPLEPETRAEMEAALGRDFGDVRLHTDAGADELSRGLSARAFTTGKDVFFREGAHDTRAPAGRETLAHELTHVVQQATRPAAGSAEPINQGQDAHEVQARTIAESVVGAAKGAAIGLPAMGGAPVPAIQRVLPTLPVAAAAAGGAAVTEPIEVIAALAGIAAITPLPGTVLGGLSYESEQADRLSENTQPKGRDYEAICLHIGWRHPVRPNIYAVFKVVWQGNAYGEIGAARVKVDLGRTSEFHTWGSSLSVKFRALRNLIQPGGDKRTWEIQWDYEGRFDPAFAGQYSFQGMFAIDAFGNFRSLEHRVRDESWGFGGDPGSKIVLPGPRISAPIPPPPGGGPPPAATSGPSPAPGAPTSPPPASGGVGGVD